MSRHLFWNRRYTNSFIYLLLHKIWIVYSWYKCNGKTALYKNNHFNLTQFIFICNSNDNMQKPFVRIPFYLYFCIFSRARVTSTGVWVSSEDNAKELQKHAKAYKKYIAGVHMYLLYLIVILVAIITETYKKLQFSRLSKQWNTWFSKSAHK